MTPIFTKATLHVSYDPLEIGPELTMDYPLDPLIRRRTRE